MSGGKPRDKAALMNWIRRNSPTREELLASRFIRPFAHRVAHSHLWRFTRTSVPRGTALGLFVGIFFLIPGFRSSVLRCSRCHFGRTSRLARR